MAKKFQVTLVRQTEEVAHLTVEAKNQRDAAFLAAHQSPEWNVKTTSTTVADVGEAGDVE